MGHLFRSVRLADALSEVGQNSVFFINDDVRARLILADHGLEFHTLRNYSEIPEERLVREHGISVWVNDRLDTCSDHAHRVQSAGAKLVTFDDHGSGASVANLHIAALRFDSESHLTGRRILRGIEYLILDPAIQHYRHLRTCGEKVAVTLGGSDTWGATIKVVEILKTGGRRATVFLGPAFAHQRELASVVTEDFEIRESVSSLTQDLADFDIAITGAGITLFEACAAGLPCIAVANELHEVANARYVESLGCAKYAGHHTELDPDVILSKVDVETMSRAGLEGVTSKGRDNVVRELLAL